MDRLLNLYLFAVREHADEKRREQIDDALTPPITAKNAEGVPAWYGSDDDAWEQWQQQARRT